MGKAALSLHLGDIPSCQAALEGARKLLLPSLAAASMESYSRAYPLLCHLQLVQEIDAALPLGPQLHSLGASGHNPSSTVLLGGVHSDRESRSERLTAAVGVGVGSGGSLLRQLLQSRLVGFQQSGDWDCRLSLTQSSLAVREPLLAIRRMLLEVAGSRREEGGAQWLQLAVMNRKAGHYEAAGRAVLEAQAAEARGAEIEAAKLQWVTGQAQRAVGCLHTFLAGQERGGQDINRSKARGGLGSGGEVSEQARALLLLARWSHETRQKAEGDLVGMFRKAVDAAVEWDKPYFYLAR